MNTRESDLLDMLEELLSVTEETIALDNSENRKTWQRISAAVADLRDGTGEPGDEDPVKVRRKISRLSRERVISLLENVSIACGENESLETLREALAVNVEDGTISPETLEDDS